MGTYKTMSFSGSWYPSDAQACEQSICSFLKEKNGPALGHFLAGIVPHAGWFFSGSIACRVIASLAEGPSPDLVILFGGHLHPDDKTMVLARGGVQTPFGNLDAAEELAGQVQDQVAGEIDILACTPDQFPEENTLELQYPFVKYFFPTAKIFSCCVPPSEAAVQIGRIVSETAQDMSLSVRVIGSTDMTHYGPSFGMTRAGTGKNAVDWVKNENDCKAIEAMMELDERKIIHQGLANQNMCCAGAAAATVSACKTNGAVNAMQLDYATSFEKSESDSFVGYSGILYS